MNEMRPIMLAGAVPLALMVWKVGWLTTALLVLASLAIVGVMLLAGAGVVALCDRLDPVGSAGGCIDVDTQGVLRIYRKRLFRAQILDRELALDRVVAITWWAAAVGARSEEFDVVFWDRDPELTFGVFGPSPRDRNLRMLDMVSERIIRVSPLGAQRLRDVVEERSIDCNIDLTTLQPVKDRLPPLEAGIEFQGNHLIVRKPQPVKRDPER